MGSSPFDCTSATPRSPRGVSLCRAGTLSLWLTRSALCAAIAIPSLRSLRVPSTAPSSPQGTISNTPQNCGVFAYEPAAPLRVAKMQAVHSLLVSPLHSETIALSLISARGSLFAVECAFTYHTKMYETATFRT